MPLVDFDLMPEHARLWIFAAERPLDSAERDRLLLNVDSFLETWRAHGAPLNAARDWRYDRFLFVSVDEAAAGVSGCSIDALIHDIRALEKELQTTLFDNAPVVFRDGADIRRVTRDVFAEMAKTGSVTVETPVFNNTLTNVGQLESGEWEVPAAKSWHARAFF